MFYEYLLIEGLGNTPALCWLGIPCHLAYFSSEHWLWSEIVLDVLDYKASSAHLDLLQMYLNIWSIAKGLLLVTFITKVTFYHFIAN